MESINCPVPHKNADVITIGHGGGGLMMQTLLREDILPQVSSQAAEHDAARISMGQQQIAMTTDSYVVQPLFFPGGDIGKLAVCGTVNDLCVAGATPVALSLGLIIEEGLPRESLRRIMASIGKAASDIGVQVVTGDTKVVERGSGDGIFINTAGLGYYSAAPWTPSRIGPGDKIVVTGDIGRHAAAIMAARESWGLEHGVESDVASLRQILCQVGENDQAPHCARDLTRGGLASALCELTQACGYSFHIEENAVPVAEDVGDLCEILGLDPLFMACEGRAVLFVAAEHCEATMAVLRHESPSACVIGEVGTDAPGVRMIHTWGSERILSLGASDPLPRIC